MMEQPHSRETHDDPVFIADGDHVIISDRSARLCDILHTAAVSSLDIVTEREERIGSQ